MKVVLLKDVPKLGRKNEVKEASKGYALNFLIPNGLAKAGTKEAIVEAEIKAKKIEGEAKVHAELLSKSIEKIKGSEIEITGKANEKGHLFAAVHETEIAQKLSEKTNLTIAPEYIKIKEPIKEVGEHTITVRVEDKKAEVKITVSAA